MLDIQFIRDNAELVQEKSEQKGYKASVSDLLKLDTERRELLGKIEALRAERNQLADALKAGNPSTEQIDRGREVKQQVAEAEALLDPVSEAFNKLLAQIPNMPTDDTPVGRSEADNQVTKTVGEQPKFDFKPKSDAELGQLGDLIDKDRATKVAGARFAYIKNGLVHLQFGLINWVISVLNDQEVLAGIIKANNLEVSDKPFAAVIPPAVASTAVYEATGRLNSEEQTYKLADDDLWLNASAEHTMAPMYMDEVLPEDQLPIRYVGYTTAFRREAGSYGKDTEGIFRMHQFDKLEMEVFSTPETGLQEHLFLVAVQEYLISQLGLPYQVLLKCTADIGKPNARGVDINVWMPAQGEYRETHTADFITDYQTRRMKTRVRRANGNVELAHTNDATAFALGRIMKAIIENYQNADGSIRVPDVLKPYLGGRNTL